MRFSPGGTLLAAAGDGKVVSLYAVGGGGGGGWGAGAGAAAGGDGGDDGFNTTGRTGEQVALLRGHASWVFCVDWSTSGELLASCGWEGKVRVWDVRSRVCVAVVGGEGGAGAGCLWGVRWLGGGGGGGGGSSSAFGRRPAEGFVTAGRDGAVRFYREAAG